MQEIKCPNCGEVFQVDETGYAQIVKQVRDQEFAKENNPPTSESKNPIRILETIAGPQKLFLYVCDSYQ